VQCVCRAVVGAEYFIMTSEFKAQNESGYRRELRNEIGCDMPVTLCSHRLDRRVFYTDFIDERTNERERKPYSSHIAMRDVGEGKCENGHKKYSQALGNRNLICSKGHVFVTVYTHSARMGLREHTHTHTHKHTHTATSQSFRLKNFKFTQN
jgi:hypothetical protein